MGYKYSLDTNGNPVMSYDADPTIATDLLFSALVKQGSFFFNPDFGLRELPKKNTAQNIALIGDSYKESAKWLIAAGRAKSIDVLAEPDESDRSRVDVQMKAVQANDKPVEFETFVGLV